MYKSEAWQNLSEASRSIRTLPNRLAREAALEELAEVKREMEEGVTAGLDKIKSFDLGIDPSGSDEPQGANPTPDQPDTDQPVDATPGADPADADQPNDATPAADPPNSQPEGSSPTEN
jgi:hypothetical protein